MTIYATLSDSTDQTRQALHAAFATARTAGDKAEMKRLEALAVELDGLRRRLALGALADAVGAVEAIQGALNAGPSGGTAGETVAERDVEPEVEPEIERNSDPEIEPDSEPAADRTDEQAAGPVVTDDIGQPSGQMAWGAVARRKHGDAFNDKVRAIAGRLGCDPNYLMAAMAFETAETFSPSIVNGAGSGATGLIQFMPSTARGLGTTTARLAQMSALDQLDLVEAYFRTATRRPLRTLSDIYMAILWPIAVGKPESHVLFRKPGRAYTQNRGFDVNGDGVITKAEATAKVQQTLVKGMKAGRIG